MVSQARRIAIIVPVRWHSSDPSQFSINLALYVRALQRAGHTPLLYCREDSVFETDFPVIPLSMTQFENRDFWIGQRLQGAIILARFRNVGILRSLASAEIPTVAKEDSDGIVSVRVFPRSLLRSMVTTDLTAVEKLRTLKHWVALYCRGYKSLDLEVLTSIEASGVVAVETNWAAAQMARFLRFHRREDLLAKITVFPHLVSTDLLNIIIPEKQEQIVAVGRWDSWQKDANLLVSCLDQYLSKRPNTEVALIGRRGEVLFSGLSKRFTRVHYLGAIPHDQIVQHLAKAQVLLLTSQWETFHIAAHEALCCGATVVGPPDTVPMNDVCADGNSGTMASVRSAASLCKALEEEMERWRRGLRVPEAIAARWRPYLSPDRVVAEMLLLMESLDPSAQANNAALEVAVHAD